MRKFIFIFVILLISSKVLAETVGGLPAEYSPQEPQYIDNSVISEELLQVKRSLLGHKEQNKFVLINKCVPNASCMSYVVELETGSIVDSFPTINGAGQMGCTAKSTEPGLFQMSRESSKPGSHHDNWGADQSLFTLKPIDPTITRCPHDTEKVLHARKDVTDKDNALSTKNTAGCVGLSENKYKDLKEKYAKLGIVIYNVENLKGVGH